VSFGDGVALPAFLVHADEPGTTQPATQQARRQREATTKPAEETPVTTNHEATIAGNSIRYKATAGMVTLKDDLDKPRAKMFYVAYTVPGEQNRPVTFVFNGGPGAAAIWLHLGTAGPMRVKLNDDGTTLPPPYALVDRSGVYRSRRHGLQPR
jgi:carboxypeptidase C (cathepsin A)